jgi:hypothetical protein
MERSEHGGVPVFWEQGEGDAMAALLFRAGIADEEAGHRGQTHLVEHLTLFGLGRRDYAVNGAKSGLLVLTDRRLLFLSKKPTGEDLVELPLADLDRAEARSSLLGGTKLRVAYEGDHIEFKGIEPKERAGKIAEEIADAD